MPPRQLCFRKCSRQINLKRKHISKRKKEDTLEELQYYDKKSKKSKKMIYLFLTQLNGNPATGQELRKY